MVETQLARNDRCVIIGAGPAGLTAGVELSKLGFSSVIFEADDCVGGLARTVDYKGYRFDIGGHRFFTKVDFVEDFWREIMGDDFLARPRLSRIYYRGRFFDYPIRPANATSASNPNAPPRTRRARISLLILFAAMTPPSQMPRQRQPLLER